MKWYSYIGSLLVCVQSASASMESALPNMPSAELLGHGMYLVQGQLSYGTIEQKGRDETIYPYNTSLFFGLFNRGELGVTYGSSISLYLKTQLFREEGFLPSLAFGARDIFASREAHFYAVPDSQQNSYEGQVFIALTKNIFDITKIHGGVTVTPTLNKGNADIYFGVEQVLGAGISADFELFQRHDQYHQSLGISWRYKNDFRVSLGMAELKRWFYQNDKIGFYTKAEPMRNSLYNSPTLYATISISGWMKEDETKTLAMQLQELEHNQKSVQSRSDTVSVRLNRVEAQLIALVGPQAEEMKRKEQEIERIIQEILTLYNSPAYDPKKIQSLQDSILGYKEAGTRTLSNLAEQQTIDPEFRIHAIKIIGYSKSPAFINSLNVALQSRHTEVKREAIFALARIGTQPAYRTIEPMTSDTDLLVAETAKQVLSGVSIKKGTGKTTASDKKDALDLEKKQPIEKQPTLEELNRTVLEMQKEIDRLKDLKKSAN